MEKEKQLKYILLAGLPVEERQKLKENLKNNTAIELIDLYQSEAMWKTLEERELPGEECLLVSGMEHALAWGREKGLPTVGYQPVTTPAGWQNTEEQPETKNDNQSENRKVNRSETEEQPKSGGANQPTETTYLKADMIVEGFDEVDDEFLLRIWQRYYGKPWTILTTERCVVRELELSDLDKLFELYENPKLTEYMEGLYPYEEEKVYQKSYIECMYRFFGYGMWLVFEKKTGKLIGRAGIEHREELNGELELGYAIHPDYQRKGYATEVCRAIIEYAFCELDFEEICCLIEKENLASIHFAEQLGFHFQKEMLLGGKEMFKYVLLKIAGK